MVSLITRPALIAAMLFALAGCDTFKSPRQAPSCSGPITALNPGLWNPSAEDLRK